MRIALGVEYNGYGFYGWQTQNNLPTIQGHLEAALSRIADEPIQLFCAGRTDAGVHATGQVVHFETQAMRKLRAWVLGANAYLSPAIAVKWVQFVEPDFHARFSALSRRYRYIIYNSSRRPALQARRVTWHHQELDMNAMLKASQFLLGEQDFSSFRSAECAARTPMRNVHYVHISRQEKYVIIEIQANAFLHHMVRNIVGVLMRIGTGRETPGWLQNVLLAKNRSQAAETAPADGLYLCHVNYPSHYIFPPEEKKIFI